MLLAELQERHQIRVAFEVQLILYDRRWSDIEFKRVNEFIEE